MIEQILSYKTQSFSAVTTISRILLPAIKKVLHAIHIKICTSGGYSLSLSPLLKYTTDHNIFFLLFSEQSYNWISLKNVYDKNAIKIDSHRPSFFFRKHSLQITFHHPHEKYLKWIFIAVYSAFINTFCSSPLSMIPHYKMVHYVNVKWFIIF